MHVMAEKISFGGDGDHIQITTKFTHYSMV